MSSQGKESESLSSSQESSGETFQENSAPHSSSGRLKVTFLASEWRSSKGGLSTLNRELAINVAKHPEVEVTFFVPRCNDEDKKAAHGHGINLVKAEKLLGIDELTWLNFPPSDLQIDVVVGHGVKLGPQAQVIRKSHKCKWVQVVHTAPEELGMYKTYSNPVSVNEKKHEMEVALCKMADLAVTVGPKLSEAFRAYLRGCKKDQMVVEFTPGIFAEFSEVHQVVDERKKFRVLAFGRGDDEDFELKGFDIAAKAVATLDDTHLTFVGAPDGKQDEVKIRLLKCSIPAQHLTVRSYLQSRESLKDLLCEVDLAIMPSRTEGFGLTGLEALSAGLPILVSRNSGFGEALSNVLFGPFFVIDSEDSEVWAKAIKDVRDRNRKKRLQESKALRASYEKEYSWENQTKTLVSKMISMTQDSPITCRSSAGRTVTLLTQQTEDMTERLPGTVLVAIKIDRVTFQKAKSKDPVQQEEAKRLIMKEMTKCFLETHAAEVPVENYPLCLDYYLKGVLDLLVREAIEGSLLITVECSTLEILERLWKDYWSGNLNAEAEERLLTDDIKNRFDVESVELETTILEKDYLACKLFLMDKSKVDQDSSLKEDELLAQHHPDQAADETQTQTAEEEDRDNVKYRHSDNGVHEERGESQQRPSEEETSVAPVDEPPQYFQHLNLIHDSTRTEGSENSLRLAVRCNNLEGLERLWEDYRSGRLNEIAEKYLVTDEIKRRFHVESVNLATTIQEEDYLACKEFLSSKPKSNTSSPGKASTQTSTETQTQIAVKHGTLEKIQIQLAEDNQSQMADESEIFVLGNTRSPSLNETRTFTEEGTETQDTAETQIPSAEETKTRAVEATETGATGVSKIPSVEKIETQTTTESTNPAEDETQLQHPGETYTCTNTAEYDSTKATEDTDIKFPEKYETKTTEKSEPSSLNDLTKGSTRPGYFSLALSSESLTQVPKEDQIHFAEERIYDAPLEQWIAVEKCFGSVLDIDAPAAHSSNKAFKINTTLTRLNLSGKMVSDRDVRSLSDDLKVNNTWTSLNLRENNIGDSGASHLSEALKKNKTLKSLDVSDNNIGDSGAAHLSEALKVNGTLSSLNVSWNNIADSGAAHLFEALKVNETLTDLDVTSNNIGGDSGATHLSEALKLNRTLACLNVSLTNIGDSGAAHQSEALKLNRTLAFLNVSLNNIGDSGAAHLSEALKVNETLSSLNVSWNNIRGDSGAAHLFEALKLNRTLACLNVTLNNIGDTGAAHLSEALKLNRTLACLYVRSNNIGDSGAAHLSEALKVNGTLKSLVVSHNNIGDSGAAHLSEALKLNRALTSLYVSWNNIGDSGACHLSEALKVNGTLEVLDVSWNNIGDSGAAHLSEALKVNGTLRSLDVIMNNIGDSGAAHLSEDLKANVTLTSLNESKDNTGDSGVCDLFGLTSQRNVGSFSRKVCPKSEERNNTGKSTTEARKSRQQKEGVSEHQMTKTMTPTGKERRGSKMAETALGRVRPHASHTGRERSGLKMMGTASQRKRSHTSHTGRETTTVSEQRKLETRVEKKEELSEHAK